MSTLGEPVSRTKNLIAIRMVHAEPPWEACLIPVPGFPVPEKDLTPVGETLRRVSGELAKGQGKAQEVFIQFNQLHVRGGANLLSEHGREWMPQPGLGVWPSREAPTLWTKEDFEMLPVGSRPRPLSYQIFRVCGSARAKQEACDLMFGRGTILEILVPDSANAFLAKTKALLLPSIKERAFRSHTFYVPLLDRNAIEASSSLQLDEWLCGATTYIRESVEDNGIVIVSKKPLTLTFQALGGRFEAEPEPHWEIPF